MKRLNFLMVSAVAGLLGAAALDAAAPVKWVPYNDASLGFEIKVPQNWTQKSTLKAVAFTGPGNPDTRPGLGILQGTVSGLKIEDAAQQEFKKKGSPADWKQVDANVDGARAIKIITSAEGGKKLVEYYVEHGDSYYLIQCVAPAAQWQSYGGMFATMLRTFHFSL